MTAPAGLSSVVADLVGRIAVVEVRSRGNHSGVLRVHLGERLLTDTVVQTPSSRAAYASCLRTAAVGVVLARRAGASAIVLDIRCSTAGRALSGEWGATAGRKELADLNRAIGSVGRTPVYIESATGLLKLDGAVVIEPDLLREEVGLADRPRTRVAPPRATAAPRPSSPPQSRPAPAPAAPTGWNGCGVEFEELLALVN